MCLLTTQVNHGLGWHATQLHNELKLLLLIVSWEKWLTGIQLCQNAAKTPDVYLFGILYSENNFW